MLVRFSIPRKPFASPRPRFSTRRGYVETYFPKDYIVEKEVIKDLFENDFGDEYRFYNGDVQVRIEYRMPFPKTSFNDFNGSKAQIAKELNTLKPHNKKPDLDNLAKTYLDALNGVAWEDDSQISKLVLVKKWSFTEEVILDIYYTEIDKPSEISSFKDILIEKEKGLVNEIYENRKNKKK